MLTDEDKKWIAVEISGSEGCVGAIAGFEQRIGVRLEKFEATLVTEFHK